MKNLILLTAGIIVICATGVVAQTTPDDNMQAAAKPTPRVASLEQRQAPAKP